MEYDKEEIKKGIIYGIVAIILITIFLSIAIIPAGHRGVLLTWGKVENKILPEGLSLVTPYMNRVVVMSIQTQKYEADASSASADLQIVKTKVALNYKIDEKIVNKLYQTIGLEFENRIIQPAIQEVVKASTAKFKAEELITKRELIKESIENGLSHRLKETGIEIQALSITDFDFSPEFNKAIEEKVKAEQDALASKNILARKEYEAKQVIATAEGTKQAKILTAQGEAEAIRIQSNELKNNKEILQLRWIEKWNGKLPIVMLGEQSTSLVDITKFINETAD